MKRNNHKTSMFRRSVLAGAAMLALSCAVDQGASAQAPTWLCLKDSGPPTGLVEPVDDLDEFSDVAQAKSYYQHVIQDARHGRDMQQQALEHLLADPRWAHPEQRDALALAVKQTIETIEGLNWRENYAGAQLARMSLRG